MIDQWPGKLQKKLYDSPFVNIEVGKVTVADWPPPTILVCAMTRVSPGLMWSFAKPAPAPSPAMPAMSEVFATTKLWPIACAGSLPAWCSVTSTSVQSAAMAISFLSNCIASLPVMSTLQVFAANELADAASSVANASVRISFMMPPGGWLVGYAEALLHD